MEDFPVVPVERLDMRLEPRPWPFAIERRAEIAAHFAGLQRQKPAVWNGRVLMLHTDSLEGGVFRGRFLESDYASLLAWRAWDFADKAMKVIFAMSALRSADGAFLLGLMGAHTANAGLLYFPTGTLEPTDVRGDLVDLDGSLRRELKEETGLDAAEFEVAAGWHAVLTGPRIAMVKVLQSADKAEALRARILRHLAREAEPELADMVIVRGPADLDRRMPPYVTAFLSKYWS